MRSCVYVVSFLRGGPRIFELTGIIQRFSQGKFRIAHICMLRAAALTEHLGCSLECHDRFWIFSQGIEGSTVFYEGARHIWMLIEDSFAHFDDTLKNAFGFLWPSGVAYRIAQMEFNVNNVKIVIIVDGTQQLASLLQFLFCYEVLAEFYRYDSYMLMTTCDINGTCSSVVLPDAQRFTICVAGFLKLSMTP